jgi:hypothetical protein
VGKLRGFIVSIQQRQGYTKSVEGRVVLHTLALTQVIQRSRVQSRLLYSAHILRENKHHGK